MANKFIGFSSSSGIFEADGKTIPYDNVVIHYISDESDKVIGQSCETHKIKRTDFESFTGFKDESFLTEVFGYDINFGFSMCGGKIKVNSIRFVKPTK